MAFAIRFLPMKSFTLKVARKDLRGLTQDELAAKSGVDQTTISGIEIGKVTNPTFRTVCKLAKALRLRPEQLIVDQHEVSA